MKAEEIETAFSERVINRGVETCHFEDLACSMASLKEVDKLNILPSLMIYVLEKNDNRRALNYAEMIIFCLMPQSVGWEDLIDTMNRKEVLATLEWLMEIKNYSFVENCSEELLQALNLFESTVACKYSFPDKM